MKKVLYIIFSIWFAVNAVRAQSPQPLQVDHSPVSASCNINGQTFSISAPHEALTGENIPLNITLPGTLDPSCTVDVDVSYQSPNNKIHFVASSIGFNTSGNTLSSAVPFSGNDGMNFNIYFRFSNHVTCNGEKAQFLVHFTVHCNGTEQSCTATVSTTARAANYWTVYKEFMVGNLTCGISKWRTWVINQNPNPSDYGNYQIQGTLTENVPYPVLSGASHNVFSTLWNHYYVTFLQNCANQGSTIVNVMDYNFTLGDGCETMIGQVSDTSDVLVSPNAQTNFSKAFYSTAMQYNTSSHMWEIPAGCSGYYKITFNNPGNVPWHISEIKDIIPPQVTVTSVNPPAGWTVTQSGSQYTFTAPTGFTLAPGNSVYIHLNVQINSNVSAGTVVNNMAVANYQATGGVNNPQGGNNNACPGVNCPTIDTTMLADTVHHHLLVSMPFAVEHIKKCIEDAPPGKIYQIGDTIHFVYYLYNSGSGNLNTTITDNMGLPNQNLQVIPGSFQTEYYTDNWLYYNSCNPPLGTQQPVNFTVQPDFSNPQAPSIQVQNMPSLCDNFKSNLLVMHLDAIVGPQMYGSKYNLVQTSHGHQSGVGYTVDQTGILEVNKSADQQFVENGQNFHYQLQITNSGSVPLNTLSVSDTIPSCVSLNGNIQVVDNAGNNVNFTTSGNLQVQIDPSVQLPPGQSFTLIIPVTKQGGGSCCNKAVYARGTMTTSGTVLQANNGSEDEPAACVQSTQCCDIPDAEVHLFDNGNGQYSLSVNGGSVPIQEVDVSLIDYHVEYNQADCQPADRGQFGDLHTSTALLGGLVLDSLTNGTHSLSWNPGTPTVLNQSISLQVDGPDVLNLECCKVQFYFCLKVRLKDANCNVCEQVVCPEPAEEPCDLSVDVKNEKEVCVGDTLHIGWSGTSPSDCVKVFLYPTGQGQPIQIATGQNTTGHLDWVIPSTVPCDRKWRIVVADCKQGRECHAVSQSFVIKCCETSCQCGDWGRKRFRVYTEHSPSTIVAQAPCRASVSLTQGIDYILVPPEYHCQPQSRECQPEFLWHISSPSTDRWYHTDTLHIGFNQPADYSVEIYPQCGGTRCEPCEINLHVEPCDGSCRMIQDFENTASPTANWKPYGISYLMILRPVYTSNNHAIVAKDQTGASYIYNDSDYHGNLLDRGCVFQYDMIYRNMRDTTLTTRNGVIIYQGANPVNTTIKAWFKLNPASAVQSIGPFQSLSPFSTIKVPIRLAQGNTLPANSMGKWYIRDPVTHQYTNTVTPALRAQFNQLIQNVSGIAFTLDVTSQTTQEYWWFDNLCFLPCCTTGGTVGPSGPGYDNEFKIIPIGAKQ